MKRLISLGIGIFVGLMPMTALSNEQISEQSEIQLSSLMSEEHFIIDMMSPDHIQNVSAVEPYSNNIKPQIEYSAEWLALQPSIKGDAEWRCMTEALYFEARGESVKGQFAVAEVILNRLESRKFPDTVCDVIHQGTGRKHACQFSYTCDGKREVIGNQKVFERLGKIAALVLDGTAPRDLTKGATHYHTKAVRPGWSNVYPRTTTIGVHHFYRQSYKTAQR